MANHNTTLLHLIPSISSPIMSNPPPAPTTSNPPQLPDNSPWSEEKHVEALCTLDELERQLINLRSVIPNIIHPLTASYPTPVAMFHDLSTRACSSSEDIATFTTLWTKSAPIFARAQHSRNTNPTGIKRIRGGDHFLATTTTPEPASAADAKPSTPPPVVKEEEEEQGEDAMELDTRPWEEVLAEFRAREPYIVVDEESGGKRLKVTLPRPAGLVFVVERGEAGVGVSGVRSEREGPVLPVHTAVLRAVNTGKGRELGRVLEMIGQYKGLFAEKCGRCGKLMGGTKLQLPVVRRYVGGEGGKKWVAGHEECLA